MQVLPSLSWAGMIEAGCHRGPLAGLVGATVVYQAVLSTIPPISRDAWPADANTVTHCPGPGWL